MAIVSARPSLAGQQAGSSGRCMIAAWRVLTRTVWRSLPHRTQLQPVSRFATACAPAPATSGPPAARPLAYPPPAPSWTSEASAQPPTRTSRTGAWTVPAGAVSGRQPQLILGIESSCDDTGVAVVSSDGRILGEALASQVRNRRPCWPVSSHRQNMALAACVPSVATASHLLKPCFRHLQTRLASVRKPLHPFCPRASQLHPARAAKLADQSSTRRSQTRSSTHLLAWYTYNPTRCRAGRYPRAVGRRGADPGHGGPRGGDRPRGGRGASKRRRRARRPGRGRSDRRPGPQPVPPGAAPEP